MRALLTLGLLVSAAQAAPTQFRLSPESELVVKVYKEPTAVAAGVAHDHLVVARRFTGQLTYDAARPTGLAVEVTVDANHLETDPPELRRKHGMSAPVDLGARKTVDYYMKAEGQLFVARYPTIHFESTRVTADGSRLSLTGEFTLRGVTRSVTLPVAVHLDAAGRLHLRGTLRLFCLDYGFKPYSAMFGAVRNAPHMDLVLALVAQPQP